MLSMMISLTMFLLIIGVTVAAPSEIPIARVLTAPCSKNVTLNHEVSLNCTAVATHICWEIVEQNSSRFICPDSSQYVTVDVAKHIIKDSLTMNASSHENNATVRCIAISSTGQNKSDWARILVQGLLKKVSDLTVTLINSTTVLISWSPPFTLEGVPILGYNVTIANTTSGENVTMLVGNTTLLYSIDHPDPENNITVTVVPINEVGAGQPAKCIMIPVQPEPTTRTSRTFVDSPTLSLTSTSFALPLASTSFAVSSKKLTPTSHTPKPPQPVVATVVPSVMGLILMIGLLVLMVVIIRLVIRHRRKSIQARLTLSQDTAVPILMKPEDVQVETSQQSGSCRFPADHQETDDEETDGSHTCSKLQKTQLQATIYDRMKKRVFTRFYSSPWPEYSYTKLENSPLPSQSSGEPKATEEIPLYGVECSLPSKITPEMLQNAPDYDQIASASN